MEYIVGIIVGILIGGFISTFGGKSSEPTGCKHVYKYKENFGFSCNLMKCEQCGKEKIETKYE